MLDLVQDIAEVLNIQCSMVVQSTSEKADLFLYNPHYCEVPSSVLDQIETVIIVDGVDGDVLANLDESAAAHVTKVYHLQCRDCSEAILNGLCASKANADPEKCEKICKLSAVAALAERPPINPSLLVKQATAVRRTSNPYEDLGEGLSTSDFWSFIVKENPVPVKLAGDIHERDHEWTARERNQLVRSVSRLGWNRWKDVQMEGGFHLDRQTLMCAGRAVLRELMSLSPAPSSHQTVKSLIQEAEWDESDAKDDKDFMQNTCFNEPQFRVRLEKSCEDVLRQIETVVALKGVYRDNFSAIPVGRVGSPPAEWWSIAHDQVLVYGSFKYGIGNYDHFSEDPNPQILSVFAGDVQYRQLTDRLFKIVHHLSSKSRDIPVPLPQVLSVAKSQEKWTLDDERALKREIAKFGIPERPDGGFDLVALAKACKIDHKKCSGEIQKLIHGILSAKEKVTKEESGRSSPELILKHRVDLMKSVRLLTKDGDALRKAITKLGRWHFLRDMWTVETEFGYWNFVLEKGIGEFEDAQRALNKSGDDSGKNVMKFSCKSVGRRVSSLLDITLNKNAKSRSKQTKEAPTSKHGKRRDSPNVNKPTPVKGASSLPALKKSEHRKNLPQSVDEGPVRCPLELRENPGCWILSFGFLDPEVEECWAGNNLYPVGYKIKRPWDSLSKAEKKEDWIGEISVSHGALTFTVYPESDPTLKYVGRTSTGAFRAARSGQKKPGVIGNDLWLFKNAQVISYLRNMAVSSGKGGYENYGKKNDDVEEKREVVYPSRGVSSRRSLRNSGEKTADSV
jgi:hypothetical protein